jgi:hypothetical protein
MKGILAVASVVGALVLAAVMIGSGGFRAAASQGCTNHSFIGAYGYTGTGSVYQAGQEVGDFAAAGWLVADGQGNMHGKQEGTGLGAPTGPQTFTGTYTVNADCTGHATTVFVGSPPNTYHFVIVEGGEQVDVAQTSPGSVLDFTLQKLSDGGDGGND